MTVAFVLFLAAMAVALIKRFGALTVVKRLLNRYGEVLMKTVYIGVGLYVFYDSGLLVHIINLV